MFDGPLGWIFIALFVFAVIAIIFGFIFTNTLMFSSKARGKFMKKQIDATKYMMDESKENIKSISDDMAYATKDALRTTSSAIAGGIKEGLSDKIYCKHCGSEIDPDSKFCKNCGKEQ